MNNLITFPTTPEAFIADQEERAGRKFDDFMCGLLGMCVELFNMGFEAGAKDLEPLNIVEDTVEFYAQRGKLKALEQPVVTHFYACVQHWYNEAYRQGKEAAQCE